MAHTKSARSPYDCPPSFVPAFLFCNIAVQGIHPLPVFFSSDAWPPIFMFIFSFSNGYICSICMMKGPESLPVALRPTGGTILSFSINTGLFSGSMLSFLVLHFLCNCNPLAMS